MGKNPTTITEYIELLLVKAREHADNLPEGAKKDAATLWAEEARTTVNMNLPDLAMIRLSRSLVYSVGATHPDHLECLRVIEEYCV